MRKTFKSKRDHENVLIEKLIQGDAKSFEHVVEEYHNIMVSVARAIVGESIADEVVQDAWISAIKALPKFERRSSLKTWLLQIVSNGAKSRIRRENRYIPLATDHDASQQDDFDHRGHRVNALNYWDDATPESIVANEDLKQLIEESFQALPALQRATLTMIDIEDMKLEQVCNILDITASNARVLLHRARVAIHRDIDKYQGKNND